MAYSRWSTLVPRWKNTEEVEKDFFGGPGQPVPVEGETEEQWKARWDEAERKRDEHYKAAREKHGVETASYYVYWDAHRSVSGIDGQVLAVCYSMEDGDQVYLSMKEVATLMWKGTWAERIPGWNDVSDDQRSDLYFSMKRWLGELRWRYRKELNARFREERAKADQEPSTVPSR